MLVTAPLTSEIEWRKLQIEHCLEKEVEETLDCAIVWTMLSATGASEASPSR